MFFKRVKQAGKDIIMGDDDEDEDDY